jgi:hypothetical protein
MITVFMCVSNAALIGVDDHGLTVRSHTSAR